MKISEMIKNLQEFMNEHGDLKCWYAIDDEGNAYHPVFYKPSTMYIDKRNYEIITLGDVEEREDDLENYEKLCVVN